MAVQKSFSESSLAEVIDRILDKGIVIDVWARVSLVGGKRWTEHQEAVARFWRAVEDRLLSLEGPHLVIYQDGLAADGELGRRVVEEAARRGSLNHRLLLDLANRGADIRKTEDPSLLLEELRLARQETGAEGHSQGLKARRARLLEERDRFIGRTIAETLKEGETAVLFMGAYHDVLPYLPEDISAEPLKEPDKVRLYLEELTSGKDPQRWRRLADYLASPIPPAVKEQTPPESTTICGPHVAPAAFQERGLSDIVDAEERHRHGMLALRPCGGLHGSG